MHALPCSDKVWKQPRVDWHVSFSGAPRHRSRSRACTVGNKVKMGRFMWYLSNWKLPLLWLHYIHCFDTFIDFYKFLSRFAFSFDWLDRIWSRCRSIRWSRPGLQSCDHIWAVCSGKKPASSTRSRASGVTAAWCRCLWPSSCFVSFEFMNYSVISERILYFTDNMYIPFTNFLFSSGTW